MIFKQNFPILVPPNFWTTQLLRETPGAPLTKERGSELAWNLASMLIRSRRGGEDHKRGSMEWNQWIGHGGCSEYGGGSESGAIFLSHFFFSRAESGPSNDIGKTRDAIDSKAECQTPHWPVAANHYGV